MLIPNDANRNYQISLRIAKQFIQSYFLKNLIKFCHDCTRIIVQILSH